MYVKGSSEGSTNDENMICLLFLPDQGQASDTNELCSPLYTIGITYRDCFQFCIYITSSHILAPNVEKSYQDNFLSRPIYVYASIINLAYYYTKVLLLRNYF